MKYSGIGRHKSAIAKVFIIKIQTETQTEAQTKAQIRMHTIVINNKIICNYFQNDKYAIDSIQQFLIFVGKGISIPSLNIRIQVYGGGNTGQQKAICLALARTFCQMEMGLSEILRKENLLTQDSRVKERKKYGLKKARKAPQYSKR